MTAAKKTRGKAGPQKGGAVELIEEDLARVAAGRTLAADSNALDGKSKEPGYFTIGWEPEKVRSSKG